MKTSFFPALSEGEVRPCVLSGLPFLNGKLKMCACVCARVWCVYVCVFMCVHGRVHVYVCVHTRAHVPGAAKKTVPCLPTVFVRKT